MIITTTRRKSLYKATPVESAANIPIACPHFHATNTSSNFCPITTPRQISHTIKPVPPNPTPRKDRQRSIHGKRLLVASPYTDDDHLLDLDTLDTPCSLLAEALTTMINLTPEYAVEAYDQAFNWTDVVSSLRSKVSTQYPHNSYTFPKSDFYVIVFRSQLPVGADRTKLAALDKEAHREAVESGQLLKYWFGSPHPETGRNLATCVWRNRDDAKKGGAGPGHKKAMQAVMGIYLEWRVKRLKLTISENATDWSISKWDL